MIAKITRGNRPGDIGAYLHGPGKADEHEYSRDGHTYTGGEVIASNIGHVGDTDPAAWAARLREAIATRPEAKRPVWQVSLRNTADDPRLSNQTWADVAGEFVEQMGLSEHPWIAVRHGDDHIHIVASRVRDDGHLWAGQHDRRAAQRACTALERSHGLQQAPRRKTSPKQPVQTVRDAQKARVADVAEWRQIDHQAGRKIPRSVSKDAARALALTESTRAGRPSLAQQIAAKQAAAKAEKNLGAQPAHLRRRPPTPGRGPGLGR